MDEGDPAREAVGKINRRAVGDINPETDPACGRQEPVATGEENPSGSVNNSHLATVDLLGGGQRHALETESVFCRPVDVAKPRKSGGTIRLDIHSGRAPQEDGANVREGVQRRKGFRRAGRCWNLVLGCRPEGNI